MEDNLKKFKGKIMYHIFVDSFYRGGEPLKPYRNRSIHSSIFEDPIIGPDSHGIWCNDHIQIKETQHRSYKHIVNILC